METNLKPPQWIDSLIENGAPHHLEEEIRGDLYELFLKDVERVGLRSARRKYVVNGVGFLFKSFFWKKSPGSNNSIMLGNYFKMARRSLATYKGTAIINTL